MNKTQIYKTDAQHRNLKDEQRGSHKNLNDGEPMC